MSSSYSLENLDKQDDTPKKWVVFCNTWSYHACAKATEKKLLNKKELIDILAKLRAGKDPNKLANKVAKKKGLK